MSLNHEGKAVITAERYLSGVNNNYTVLMVIDPETMTLDSFPAVDTNTYDYLCPYTVNPDIIDLPDDTTNWDSLLNISVIDLRPKQLGLEVYQNHRQITIEQEPNKTQNLDFYLFDALGKIVHSGSFAAQSQQLDLSAQPAGSYFLQVLSLQNEMFNKKLVLE